MFLSENGEEIILNNVSQKSLNFSFFVAANFHDTVFCDTVVSRFFKVSRKFRVIRYFRHDPKFDTLFQTKREHCGAWKG